MIVLSACVMCLCWISDGTATLARRLLLFDGMKMTFRNVGLRARNPSCAVCGDNPTIKADSLIDYPEFCGAPAHDKVRHVSLHGNADVFRLLPLRISSNLINTSHAMYSCLYYHVYFYVGIPRSSCEWEEAFVD